MEFFLIVFTIDTHWIIELNFPQALTKSYPYDNDFDLVAYFPF